MEGHWEPQRGAPMILFALPDQAAETNRFEVAIPKLGSLILTHELDGAVPGLKQWPPEDRPYVPLVFFSFRLMVAIGFLMLAVAVVEPRAASARPALRGALVPPALRRLPADRLHRPARGLGDHRIRPPALGRLWADADRGCGHAGADRRRGRDLARGLRDRLRHDLPGRGLLHGPPGAARAAAERPRAAAGEDRGAGFGRAARPLSAADAPLEEPAE